MVLFPSPESREEAMLLFPINFDGHSIRLERPEDGHNRFSWRFSYFAQLSATGFPIEHWDKGGIRTAFRSIGSVCCIDPLCLNELDYSAVRLVIKLENDMDVPHALLVRDFDGSSGTEVRIRVVRVWSCDEDGSSVSSAHFDDLGGTGPGPSPGRGQPTPRMSNIDSDSLPGAPLPEPRDGPQTELMDLWRHVVDRRRAGISATLSSIRSPLTSGPVQAPPRSSSTELWDRVLARRLAAQFPEEGLDADQVRLPIHSPSPCFSSCCNPQTKPLLLQWYDTLGTPATPLVPDEEDANAAPDPVPASDHAPLPTAFAASGDEHEDAARKQRVRRKRAVDSAFKARRSSRLASKEPENFVNMLSKAKAVKASRFDLSGGSPRLRAAAVAAGFGDGAPDDIPLPRLRALAAACGVDPDAISGRAVVPSGPE
jgi:hypothetical protein